ncbi:hypothetical protein CNEO4_1510009 [Clostridium neonatale]|nr:hypothetical protein CNEO4_1690002 [Clostridium neonatale]CAI3603395.1 hypothetical protein CNEO4_1510009 [Clostridium neonatale]
MSMGNPVVKTEGCTYTPLWESGSAVFSDRTLAEGKRKIKNFYYIVRWYRNVNLSFWTNESNKQRNRKKCNCIKCIYKW